MAGVSASSSRATSQAADGYHCWSWLRAEELAGAERPANVTVIDERQDRFFSSAGPGRCWASIDSVTPVARRPGRPAGSRVAGLVYCVGALPSVGDRSSLTLGDLRFAGWVPAGAN
jgi:hypothetical protein